MNTEIIDWRSKGNVVRFLLGKNGEQHGDDWDDAPYQHNAGPCAGVVTGYLDLMVPFRYTVLEPSDGAKDYAKDQMVRREIPILVVVPEDTEYRFEQALLLPDAVKVYMGDTAGQVRSAFARTVGVIWRQ